MKIYFIRHGESEYNLAQRHSGWTQVELTEQGKAQAESLRTYLSKISFDKLYVSDLKRAIQTSQLAIPGSNAEQTPLLREYSTGKLAGRLVSECAECYGEAYKQARATLDYTPFDGENPDMIEKRARDFLDMAVGTGYQTIAAFSHAGFLRTVAGCVLGMRLSPMKIRSANCMVEIVEYVDGQWRLDSWINPAELTR